MATSPQSCSHLVAPAVIRTVKFLAAFSVAKHVVRAEWIEKSVQHGQFLGELLSVPTRLTTADIFRAQIDLFPFSTGALE